MDKHIKINNNNKKKKPTKHVGDFHNRFFLSKTQFGLHSLQTLFQTYITQWYIT